MHDELKLLETGARRVEELGVGTYVKTFRQQDILQAIHRATTDRNQIHKARILGENIRRVSGIV